MFKFRPEITNANSVFLGWGYNINNNITNCPANNGSLISFGHGSICVQLFIGYQNSGMWYRDMTNNATAEWIKI